MRRQYRAQIVAVKARHDQLDVGENCPQRLAQPYLFRLDARADRSPTWEARRAPEDEMGASQGYSAGKVTFFVREAVTQFLTEPGVMSMAMVILNGVKACEAPFNFASKSTCFSMV